MNSCVNRLPRVGQLINLNSYDCYFAVRKFIKPIIRANNCIGVPKLTKLDSVHDLGKSTNVQAPMTARENTKSKIFEEERKSSPESGMARVNHTSSSDNSSTDDHQTTTRQKMMARFTSIKKSVVYKKYVSKILNKSKEASTQTAQKSRNRFLVVD